MSTRNKVYLVLTSVVIVFMILLTGLYLNSHTKVKHHKTAESSEPSSSLVTSSSSSEEKVTKPSETKKEEEVKPTTSSSETKETQTSNSVEKKEEKPKTETKTENKSEDVKKATEEPARPAPAVTANYRYVYEAVGGDDFSVVAELTGVDVDTLAQANSMPKDAVFKHGDRIFVP